MRFASLGSGSKGNASLVELGDTCIMFDCGFSFSQTKQRLAKLGKTIDDINAIFLSHEHADHINGIGAFMNNTNIPIWASSGTARNLTNAKSINIINSEQHYSINHSLDIKPVVVPHDATEPCQFIVDSGNSKLGILTDVGHITSHIEQSFSACDALMLETNYDEQMLKTGPYPEFLKTRISSNFGHLSNQQAGQLLGAIDSNKLQHISLMHLSANNNSKERALESMSRVINDKKFSLNVATQESGIDWIKIA